MWVGGEYNVGVKRRNVDGALFDIRQSKRECTVAGVECHHGDVVRARQTRFCRVHRHEQALGTAARGHAEVRL